VSLTDHGLPGKGLETATAVGSLFAASGAATPATITPVPTTSAMHYFLKVDGINGG